MKRTEWIIGLLILALLASTVAVAILTASRNVDFNGAIAAVNVDVYNDAGLTQICTSLNVGTIAPGSIVNQTVYIKNTGNVPETLTMTVANWTPTTAGTLLSLTWNRQNYVLPANQSVSAVLSLNVPSVTGSVTSFSCTVTITGTG